MVQSAIGSLTGSQADKVRPQSSYERTETNILQAQAQDKKDTAEARHEISQAGTNIGGHSVSASGVAANDPNRQAGSWNQTMGSAKEAFGGLVGSEGMKQQGQEQHAVGQQQEAKGQLNDLGKGVQDRVGGTVGGMVAGVTGDREEQKRREAQHDLGKTLQRGAEADIQKQNPS